MAYKEPSVADVKAAAEALKFDIDDNYAETLLSFMAPFGDSCKFLDDQSDELPVVKNPQRSHHVPAAEDNPYNAWYVKTDVQGAEHGPLAGRAVAIKDNIFVAGVPMSNGTAMLEGFVPDFDATVVTRLLDAGAHVAGKSVCEYLCVSGGSFTGNDRVVDNPHKSGYSTGGSSSGSGALVGGGVVDIALGCDQAGSVRIPASNCGIYGMKATHGLLPYTGIMGMEASIDNVGPMTATVADNALSLEVMAGYDDLDGRQRRLEVHNYTDALGKDIKGLRIGVLKEGFAQPYSASDVDECVRAGSERLRALGAEVADVSVPAHLHGLPIWSGVVTDGLWQTVNFNGVSCHAKAATSPALWQATDGWLNRLDEMPPNIQVLFLFAHYLQRYHGHYYAKAMNLERRLRAAYDAALADCDLLLLPTTVSTAKPNPPSPAEASIEVIIEHAYGTIFNTCPFNATGHPGMSVPCGLRDELPVGMMLIGRHFDEPTIYRAAHAFEQSADWRDM